MAKTLEVHFSEAFGALAVQNTLMKAQLEQTVEQLEAANKELADLRPKAEPDVKTPKLKAVKD